MSHDIFVEINEKISAQFTSNGFAIHIKINGIISVKNYIQSRTNLRVQLLDNFTIMNDNTFMSEAQMAKQYPSFTGVNGSQQLNVRLTQCDETLNVPELEHTKLVSLFPKMGKSNIM